MATDIVSAYRNVCRDLQGLQAYEIIVRSRLEAAHRVVFKGKMPSSLMCYVPLDTALPSYNAAAEEYNETAKTIEQLKTVKHELEQLISTMSDAEQIVILLHVEQSMDLRQIAEKSNYSYGHLKNVSMKLRRKDMTESDLAS